MAVAVCSAECLLVKANLCLRSSRKATVTKNVYMPRLVGDRGQVLRVLGWALTRIHNLSLVLRSAIQGS